MFCGLNIAGMSLYVLWENTAGISLYVLWENTAGLIVNSVGYLQEYHCISFGKIQLESHCMLRRKIQLQSHCMFCGKIQLRLTASSARCLQESHCIFRGEKNSRRLTVCVKI